MSDAAIVVDGVTKRYGAVRALDSLSFSVPAGQMFGLIGPDGAGKTTTIRLLCGLLRADAGHVRVSDAIPFASTRTSRGRLAICRSASVSTAI